MKKPTPPPRRWPITVVLVSFAATFLTLALLTSTRQSATWDEPIHLTAGYAALAERDYRVDPSHPPLLRMWAAVPLALDQPQPIDTGIIDSRPPVQWLNEAYEFSRRFLFARDADLRLNAARAMNAVWGVVLGVMLFAWGYHWFGLTPAAVILGFYTVEPNIAAHASLVTTDAGAACLIFAAIFFLRRICQHPRPADIVGFVIAVALAPAAKFSGLLLAPIVVVLLVIAVRRSVMSWRTAAGLAAAALVAAYAAIWAVYGFSYAPSASASWLFAFDAPEIVRQVPYAGALQWIDAHHLLPNAYTQGFLYSQATARMLPGYLAGQYSTDGWWYYFPFAFVMKTPLPILLLIGIGVVTLVMRRHSPARLDALFLAVPAAIYLAFAIASGITIGLRHVLPLYPFALLAAGAAVSGLLHRGRVARFTLAAAAALAVVMFARIYPYPLTYFNEIAGPGDQWRYLADSNLDWGQGLKELASWMRTNRVLRINLAYFGSVDPRDYGIACTFLPGGPSFAAPQITRPQLPGYVAISATVLSGVYLPPWWRLFYDGFRERRPDAVLANSIRIYWVNEWPEAETATAANDINAHGVLADALLDMRWPDEAIPHYQRFLAARPDDPGGLARLGVALTMTGRREEAAASLARAAQLVPGNVAIRNALAAVTNRQR